MDKKSVSKNYRFLAILLCCMIAGALVGWFWPDAGHKIAFLGKVFINLMFCIVVPLVFSSIAGSVANMDSRQRAGKIMATTIGTFVVTGERARVSPDPQLGKKFCQAESNFQNILKIAD